MADVTMPVATVALTRAERRQKLVLKLFFLLAFSSQATAWVRAAGGNAGLKTAGEPSIFSSGNGDPVLLALNILVMLVTAFVTFPKLRTVAGILLDQRALCAVYAYSLLSVLWAENVGNSLRFALYLLLGLLQFTCLGWFLDTDEQIVTLGQTVTVLAALSIPGQYLLTPTTDLAPGWTGIFLSKNLLGNIMSIGVVALLLERGRWTVARAGKFVLCSALLVLSQSLTAMLCVALCGAVILYLRITRRQKVLLVGVCASLLLFIGTLLPKLISESLGASGKDLTLTGRDVIWAFAWKYIAQRPIFGYGYYGFWISQQDAALQYLGWNPNQAHNGFIDLLLNEGVAGLLLLIVVACVAVRRASRLIRRDDVTGAGRFVLILLVYLLVHNVSEADFYQHPAWLIFVMALVGSARASWQARYRQPETVTHEVAEDALCAPPQPALA